MDAHGFRFAGEPPYPLVQCPGRLWLSFNGSTAGFQQSWELCLASRKRTFFTACVRKDRSSFCKTKCQNVDQTDGDGACVVTTNARVPTLLFQGYDLSYFFVTRFGDHAHARAPVSLK